MSIELLLDLLFQALPILAGILGIPIVQYLKNRLGLGSDRAAVGLLGVVSGVLALGVYGIAVLTGGEPLVLSLDGVFGALPVIFGTAHSIFKFLGGNEGLS